MMDNARNVGSRDVFYYLTPPRGRRGLATAIAAIDGSSMDRTALGAIGWIRSAISDFQYASSLLFWFVFWELFVDPARDTFDAKRNAKRSLIYSPFEPNLRTLWRRFFLNAMPSAMPLIGNLYTSVFGGYVSRSKRSVSKSRCQHLEMAICIHVYMRVLVS